MKSHFYHIQVNIDFKNVSFYKDLLSFLGWSVIFETNDTIGFKSGTNGDLWFVNSQKKEQTDYDKMGMNHVSIRVEKQSDLDQVISFLNEKHVTMLFGTPKHRPEFTSEKDHTYYQVMFSSPDNILFEIVYIGPKE